MPTASPALAPRLAALQANSGPNTNGCQFFITTGPSDWLGEASSWAPEPLLRFLRAETFAWLPVHLTLLFRPSLCADNKHVVFGRVVDGMLTVRKLEAVQTGQNNRPKLPCVITQCGEM